MSTFRINFYIPKAIEYIKKDGILDENGEVDKGFRSRISQFGASVKMGSLAAAVAFYSEQGGAKTDRSKLMKIIFRLVYPELAESATEKSLLLKVTGEDGDKYKEEILDAAAAIKLGLNAYAWKKSGSSDAKEESEDETDNS